MVSAFQVGQGIIQMFGVENEKGGNPPQRQRQVAQICGISRSYVSRIEKRALEKLREMLDGK